MRIAIVGYGQMGREVEAAAVKRGHTISRRFDPFPIDADEKELTPGLLDGSDVAIEFALADAVLSNAQGYAESRTPAVVGTTGWEADRAAVESLFADAGAYLWGSNFSVGAHIFFALAEYAAGLVSGIPEYDLLMYEIHHKRKKDSPSGTALSIAERIISASRKERVVTERLDRRREENELHVASVRGGEIPGIHTVMMDSAADSIELRHTARNRGGFAFGAVLAAEWLHDKTGIYRVEDFIADYLATGENL